MVQILLPVENSQTGMVALFHSCVAAAVRQSAILYT